MPRAIIDSNWPKNKENVSNGGNSGAKLVNSDNNCDNGGNDPAMANGGNPRSAGNLDESLRHCGVKQINGGSKANVENTTSKQSQQGKYGQVSSDKGVASMYGQVSLYWWQLGGVSWGLGGVKAGLDARLIGDEMRVGKTPTAIALDIEMRKLIQRKSRGNNCTLVACPKSVIGHWADLLRDMGIRSEHILTVDLPSKQALKKRLVDIGEAKRLSHAQPHWVIINWDTVQTIRGELQRAGPWFHIVGDEIHRIKGRTTKRTDAFKKIKAKQKTGLSGTPADNRPEDFWSVLNWLRPKEYTSYWNFCEKYCDVQVNRKTGYKYINGVNWETLDELRERLAPFYIRRTLHEVAGNVPLKQRRTVEIDMGAKQRREYEEMAAEGIAEVSGGDILTPLEIVKRVRLQQMAIGCCEIDDDGDVHITDKPTSPKLDWIMEYIKDEPEAGPFIIFAQHQDTVRLMDARLRAQKIKTASIVGTDKAEYRADEVRRFQSRECECFIGTIRACREGITLSEANTIIFVDRDWSPNANRQAEARADSVNSNLPVTIITLEANDSIDQDRRLKINAKAEATDAITSTGHAY